MPGPGCGQRDGTALPHARQAAGSPDTTAASTITAAKATVEKIPPSVSTKVVNRGVHTYPAKPQRRLPRPL